MTKKEKERLFIATIKRLAKAQHWKFKSYFIFKLTESGVFLDSTFYVDPKEDMIWGWLAFKPYILDDVFWEIAHMPENKQMPLSLRAEGAFTITPISIYDYKITLKNSATPEKEIQALMDTIDAKVAALLKEDMSLAAFLARLENSEKKNVSAIITCLIAMGQHNMALEQIEAYRKADISSGFGFGEQDFYDVAATYCHKALKTSDPFIVKIGKQIIRFFRN